MTDEAKNNGSAAETITAKGLKAPRAAAIAGILFALLLSAAIVLMRISMPSDPADAGQWLGDGGRRTSVVIAINLVPFAGIAFLWFIGVIRDRLGELEDKFFATVFLGSGLLFVALLFAATAIAFGLLASFDVPPGTASQHDLWNFGSKTGLALLNVFAMRMGAVFIISASTVALRTGIIRRWLGFLGLAIGLVLLLIASSVPYLNLLFPLWIVLVSLDILIFDLHQGREPAAMAVDD